MNLATLQAQLKQQEETLNLILAKLDEGSPDDLEEARKMLISLTQIPEGAVGTDTNRLISMAKKVLTGNEYIQNYITKELQKGTLEAAILEGVNKLAGLE